jgi:hypothetical protein
MEQEKNKLIIEQGVNNRDKASTMESPLNAQNPAVSGVLGFTQAYKPNSVPILPTEGGLQN